MPSKQNSNSSSVGRLVSLDALRGFDMFFILGGSGFLAALSRFFSGSDVTMITAQMEHVAWAGLHLFDVIFPLFLFIAGVTFPFSTASRLARGASRTDIVRNIIRRMIVLILLGAVYERVQMFQWSAFRVWSVIGRIGIVWAVSALMTLFLHRKVVVAITVFVLLGWWAFLRLVPSPDAFAGADGLLKHATCFACWFDAQYLTTAHRFEGGLATIAMIPTAMFGIWAGMWLKADRHLACMPLVAGMMIVLGLVWALPSWGCPVIKDIWSGSFALVTGGISLFLLWLFHELIDVRGWRLWALPFIVIGVNAIAIYISNAFVPYGQIGKYFFGALIPLIDSPAWRDVVLLGGKLVIMWTCLAFLYRKRIFFKV